MSFPSRRYRDYLALWQPRDPRAVGSRTYIALFPCAFTIRESGVVKLYWVSPSGVCLPFYRSGSSMAQCAPESLFCQFLPVRRGGLI